MSDTEKLAPFKNQSESFTAFKDDNSYYVDKTEVISYLIKSGHNICICTRPRRFGKTLMLRTLQTFFEYKLDDQGNPVDNRHYFEGLKVMAGGERVLKHLGQYPVISLSLKDVSGDTYEKIVAMLNDAVCKSCIDDGKKLMASGILSQTHQQWLQAFMDGNASEENLPKFLGIYTQWLKEVTNRKSVILIDEYDVPLQQAAIYDNHHPGSNLFEKTVKLIGQFISSGFKSNNNLAYGIITGCMRVAKESIFTGMNNPGVLTVLDDIPYEYWGFTQDEVEKMLDYYDLSDQMDALKYWYDGYYYSGREVYNPWSLLNAIRGLVNGYGDHAIQSYWVMTSSNNIIDDMINKNPQYRHELALLIEGKTKWVPIYKDLSYRDLKLRDDVIWSFLIYTGYLKTLEIKKDNDDLWIAEVTVPNREIVTVMKSAMQHWWKDIRIPGFDVRPMMQFFWDGDTTGIMREICTLLSDSISVRDVKEDFYHGMMVGVLRTQCRIRSNREYGEGYPDIVAITGNKAVMLELKSLAPSELSHIPKEKEYIQIPELMNKALDEAETQIKSRHYVEGLLFDEPVVTELKIYAICFCRKICRVRKVETK